MEEHITHAEAAKILGVDSTYINRMIRKGELYQNRDGLVRTDAVYALAELRIKKLTLPEIASTAKQAHVLARANERKLEMLAEILGVGLPSLSYKEEDVLELYYKVEQALEQELPPARAEVMFWARTLYSITEEYLEVVEEKTGDKEPWTRYMALAKKMIREKDHKICSEDVDLRWAYAWLEKARVNLRAVAYFYVRDVHGIRKASEVFPHSVGDPHEDVLAIAMGD